MKQIEIDKNEGEKWRFTGNNFHPESGLETADMNFFKKDPMGSLARESCQNSIDAKTETEKKVKIVFQTFKINRKSIPGIDRLREEIIKCHEYQTLPENVSALERMLDNIDKEEIECLRISDYNTTGLDDVFEFGSGSFYLLTKGTGITNKIGVKGGSKGVGKFASFVVSSFNTVFYSTRNLKGEEGYIGISKLCSRIYDDETSERTDGIGYYGMDFQGTPIRGQLNIEPGFHRNTPGTDIYIIGFNESSTWKSEIITKILDSFMAAFVEDELEVEVDDILVNKNNLGVIIDDDVLVNKSQYSNIKSQYLLLTEDENSVSKKVIDMGEYGDATVYLKKFNKEEAFLSTNKCVMIRYPLMKITVLKNLPQVPFSAMCIIGNNELNKTLRKIENPQHTDWELARLNDDPVTKEEVRRVKKKFTDEIEKYIKEILAVSSNDTSDVEGAGDLLPSYENNEGIGVNKESIITDVPKIVPKVKNVIKMQNVSDDNPDSFGEIPDNVDPDSPGEDGRITSGENNGGEGTLHGGDVPVGTTPGDVEGVRLANLSGVKYNTMMPNKSNGILLLTFIPNTDAENCELSLKQVDDSGNKYDVNLLSCKINNVPAIVKDNKVINFNLKNGTDYRIELGTDMNDYFASEVRISYESR